MYAYIFHILYDSICSDEVMEYGKRDLKTFIINFVIFVFHYSRPFLVYCSIRFGAILVFWHIRVLY